MLSSSVLPVVYLHSKHGFMQISLRPVLNCFLQAELQLSTKLYSTSTANVKQCHLKDPRYGIDGQKPATNSLIFAARRVALEIRREHTVRPDQRPKDNNPDCMYDYRKQSRYRHHVGGHVPSSAIDFQCWHCGCLADSCLAAFLAASGRTTGLTWTFNG